MIAKILLPVAVKIVSIVAKKATPEIRQEIEEFVVKWEKHAKETPNPWDDIIVDVVKGVFKMRKESK